jgi:hypothetical protein
MLFLLAPAIGELLSGSSPPSEFFTPIAFLLLSALYGSGAIVVRELRIRWKKGLGSMLLLGAAYGVLEEGLMVGSFFNPHWMDLGLLGVYGRWLGVNWVWAEMLIIFHSVYSITVSIMLVELTFPKRSNENWVSKKMFWAIVALLASVVALWGLYIFLPKRLLDTSSTVSFRSSSDGCLRLCRVQASLKLGANWRKAATEITGAMERGHGWHFHFLFWLLAIAEYNATLANRDAFWTPFDLHLC